MYLFTFVYDKDNLDPRANFILGFFDFLDHGNHGRIAGDGYDRDASGPMFRHVDVPWPVPRLQVSLAKNNEDQIGREVDYRRYEEHYFPLVSVFL